MIEFSSKWLTKCIQTYYLGAFSLWYILFPFDAFVLPISVGFMTIYPFLILTVLLFSASFFLPKQTNLPTNLKLALVFFTLIALAGIVHYSFVQGKSEAKFEIRSLILQVLTVSMLFQTFRFAGSELFFKKVYQLSILLFVGLCLIGWFEFYSGIHIQGFHTEKLIQLPVGNITFAPVFIYDNNNTFLCYLFSLALIILLSRVGKRHSFPQVTSIIFQLLFFSIVADSRFGKIISVVFFIFYIASFINIDFIKSNSKLIKLSAFFLFCVIGVFAFNSIFLGPLWKNGRDYKLNSIQVISENNGKPVFSSPDSLIKVIGKEKVLKAYEKYEMHGKLSSIFIRKNLLLNGIFLTKEHPLFGVGPGQYSWYTIKNNVPYVTGTITSPHEGLTELVSQYGIPLTLLFFFVLVLTFLRFFKGRKFDLFKTAKWILCLAVFWIVAAMPSAWLVLNCGWILIAIILLSPENVTKASEQ